MGVHPRAAGHGEQRHTVANANLAIATSVSEENTIIAEHGTVIDLRDGVTDADLVGRRVLAEEGFISIFVAVDPQTANGTRDTHAFAQVVRRTVGRWVNTQHRRRPMIVPVVIEA